MSDATNLTDNLKKLEEISQWFEEQDDLDVEEGLTKVKEAASLIKSSKARLAAIENEFQAIERDVSDGDDSSEEDTPQDNTPPPTPPSRSTHTGDDPVNLDDIPF